MIYCGKKKKKEERKEKREKRERERKISNSKCRKKALKECRRKIQCTENAVIQRHIAMRGFQCERMQCDHYRDIRKNVL